MTNNRQFPRIPVSLKVSYLSQGELERDLVTDLSPGGLFVRTSKPLPIGTEVNLEVEIADREPSLHIRGQVVWLRGTHPEGGMGIRFLGTLGPVLTEMVQTTQKKH